MKFKKWLSTAICLGLIGSSFTTVSFGLQNQNKDVPGEMLARADIQLAKPDDLLSILPNLTEHTITLQDGDEGEPLYSGEGERLGGELAEDPYMLNNEELEYMMDAGYSIEDIFRADEIGNRRGLPPQDVLELKEEQNLNWEGIDAKAAVQVETAIKAKLKQTFAEEYEKLQDSGLSSDEQDKILMATIENPGLDILETAERYKSKKNLSIEVVVEEMKLEIDQQLGSAGDHEKGRLTSLSSVLQEKLERFAQANGQSAEALAEAMQQEKARQKSHGVYEEVPQ